MSGQSKEASTKQPYTVEHIEKMLSDKYGKDVWAERDCRIILSRLSNWVIHELLEPQMKIKADREESLPCSPEEAILSEIIGNAELKLGMRAEEVAAIRDKWSLEILE